MSSSFTCGPDIFCPRKYARGSEISLEFEDFAALGVLIAATACCDLVESDKSCLESVNGRSKLPSRRNWSTELMLRESVERLSSSTFGASSWLLESRRETTAVVHTDVSWMGSRAVW